MKQITTTPNTGHSANLGFWALIATQFQGAFSDNLFKMLVILYLPVMSGDVDLPITALAFLLFNIPFLLFPGFAGSLADRFSKKTVTVMTKYLELGVMTMGLFGFLLHSPALTLMALFMMASQSALFSPAKYGILPEILPEQRLSWGNGILQLGTFVAIIAGTAVAGPLLEALGGEIYWTTVVLLGLSVVGLVSSYRITKPAPADPERKISVNPWNGMGESFKIFRADRVLFLTMLGLAFFWFTGVLVSQTIIELGKAISDSPTRQSLLLAALSLGIGLGSVVAGYLSRGRVEVGLIPIGGVGLTGFCFALAFGEWNYATTLTLVSGLGIFAGIFDLPLAALLQQRSPKAVKGGMIAASNFVTFGGMTLSALLFMLLFNGVGLSPAAIFGVAGAMTLVVTFIAAWILRPQLLRFIAACLVRAVYKQQVVHPEHVPTQGGALLVSNHVSFADALLLLAASERPLRFLMYKGIYDKFWVKPVAKLAGAIPVMPKSDAKDIESALGKATEAIQRGELVVIFAEGGITRTGELAEFKRGLERIMKDVYAPIIPVHLGGVWGSIFSYSDNRFFLKIPKNIPYPVTVSYGHPLNSTTSAQHVRAAVQALDLQEAV